MNDTCARRMRKLWSVPVFLLMFFGVSLQAFAATYTLTPSGSLPSGCSSSSATQYTCASLTLSWNDVINVANANTTLTITNTFTFNGNSINFSSPASGFMLSANKVQGSSHLDLNGNITTTGELDLSSSRSIVGNLSAGGNAKIGKSVTGTLTATGDVTTNWQTAIGGLLTGKSITSGGGSTYSGGLTATNGGITLGSSDVVTGNVTATADVKVAGTINGSVTAGGKTTAEWASHITGNVSTTELVSAGGGAYGGSITATSGKVTLGTSDQVTGDVVASGAVSLGHASRVFGNVTSDNKVTLNSSNAKVDHCVTAPNGSNTIALGWYAVVGGYCCKAGPNCQTGCLENGSGYATPPACGAATPTPVAEYRFDECSWTSGSSGAVGDSVGSYHGTPHSVTTASGGVVQRAADLSASGTADYIQWPVSLLHGRTDFTLSLWFKTSVTQSQQEILQGLGSSTGDDEIEIYLINTTQIQVNLFDAGNTYTAGSSFVDGAWHHLAVTRSGTSVCVFLDATSLGCNTRGSGALSITNANALLSGQEQDSYGGSFADNQSLRAQLDEFKVFDGALNSTQIETIRTHELAGKNHDGTTRATACVSGPDHIRVFLESNTAALTCTPRSVVAIACADSTCATRYSSSVDVTLNPNGTAATIAANGTGAPTVKQTSTGTTGITLSSSSPAATGGTTFRCYEGTVLVPGNDVTGACNVTFSNAGFFVSVPNHVSCATSTLTVTAAKTDDVTKKCVPAFDSGASRDIKLRFAYGNPSSGTLVPTAGSATPPTSALATGSDLTLSMTFTGGVATTNFQYQDAGSLTVSASYAGSAGTGDAGVSMGTASNPAFVVRPNQLAVTSALNGSGAANPGTTTTAGAIFTAAGDTFTVKVRATNSCSSAVTPNFGNETTVPSVTFVDSSVATGKIYSLVVPTANTPSFGTLTVGTPTNGNGSGVTGTVAVTGNKWNEVGAITLKPYLADYLGSGSAVTGVESGTIGRFSPYQYAVSGTLAQCGTAFAYVGQPLTGTLTLTAQDKDGNATTNYGKGAASLATLAPGELTLGGMEAGLAVDTASSLYSVAFATNQDFDTLHNGTAQVAVALPVKMTDAAAPLIAPITSALQVTASTDEVTQIAGAPVNLLSDGAGGATIAFRSGRLRLSNKFGSEKSDMSMDVQAQYWSGKSWVLSNDDTCTGAALTATDGKKAVALSGYVAPLSSTNFGTSHVLGFAADGGGKWKLTLKKPDPVATGSVNVAINLGSGTTDLSCLSDHPPTTGLGLPWLRSRNGSTGDCIGITTYDRDPSARVTFGIYSPETRRTVHIREQF